LSSLPSVRESLLPVYPRAPWTPNATPFFLSCFFYLVTFLPFGPPLSTAPLEKLLSTFFSFLGFFSSFLGSGGDGPWKDFLGTPLSWWTLTFVTVPFWFFALWTLYFLRVCYQVFVALQCVNLPPTRSSTPSYRLFIDTWHRFRFCLFFFSHERTRVLFWTFLHFFSWFEFFLGPSPPRPLVFLILFFFIAPVFIACAICRWCVVCSPLCFFVSLGWALPPLSLGAEIDVFCPLSSIPSPLAVEARRSAENFFPFDSFFFSQPKLSLLLLSVLSDTMSFCDRELPPLPFFFFGFFFFPFQGDWPVRPSLPNRFPLFFAHWFCFLCHLTSFFLFPLFCI